MPKYEYACKSCGEHIEVKQSFEDAPLTECPTCGGLLRKVFSSPAIVLRGPGFYRTDHRSPYRPDGVMPAGKDKEPSESKSAESRGGESKGDDSGSKGSDSKSGDSTGGDSKGGESKGSDSWGSDSRGSDSRGSGGPSGDSGGSKDAARTA